MSITEGFVTGAKRQSYRAPSPRELLNRIVQSAPGAPADALLRRFTADVLNDEDYLLVIIEYWFTNNLRSLQQARGIDVRKARQECRERASVVQSQIRQRIQQAAAIALLDMIMPNGKKLKDCTGRECASLSQRIGPWLKAISERVGTSETVGSALTEEDLQRLYARASEKGRRS